MIAYAARYGHQPLSELRAMTYSDLRVFVRELGRIVEKENEGGDD